MYSMIPQDVYKGGVNTVIKREYPTYYVYVLLSIYMT